MKPCSLLAMRRAQGAGDDGDLTLAAGEADRDAGAAARDQDTLMAAQDVDQFGDGFSFCNDHISSPVCSSEFEVLSSEWVEQRTHE